MSAYHAKKRMGQHFLQAPDVIARIADLVSQTGECDIVEVGPGQGSLTMKLASSGRRLIAVELDRDLIETLSGRLRAHANTTVVHGDFLRFHPEEYGLDRFVLVGNLPYNITSPVIEWCVSHVRRITSAVFMVQKEVASRLAASPGSHDWSPLGIFTQLCFDVRHCFDVSPESFKPRPKVRSSVVQLTPKPHIPAERPELFERAVRASFRQRRKLLVNNLVPDLIDSVSEAKRMLDILGLAKDCRAEQLSIEQFMRITDYLSALRGNVEMA